MGIFLETIIIIFLFIIIIFFNNSYLLLKTSLGTFIDSSQPLERHVSLQVDITIHKLMDQPFEMVTFISNENILSLNKTWATYL